MNASGWIKQDWAWARVHLGITKEEFLSLSPSEWVQITEVWLEEQKRRADREDRLVARLLFCLNLMLVPRKPGDPLPKEEDYLPKLVLSEEEEELAQAERLKAQFMAATANKEHQHGSGT